MDSDRRKFWSNNWCDGKEKLMSRDQTNCIESNKKEININYQ